jgi:hypothetical protein
MILIGQQRMHNHGNMQWQMTVAIVLRESDISLMNPTRAWSFRACGVNTRMNSALLGYYGIQQIISSFLFHCPALFRGDGTLRESHAGFTMAYLMDGRSPW